ncbi:MAG: amino acid transporter substrate-binding protein [Anaerosolibacter sp.]|jgi:cystine transport system substrate-binding protein|uniref:amino acid ABC transporter substrate-binding protein n=1 Tax=Anaerosolibacter sp. TaxID=1872527 RepID=UPI0026120B55|nr:amino acid ABC transporter substrate-binding protein [Anaerosolibacter sp.]MDF2548207.1 amino acid transporter substrate-binding protein [Anaerosolibacter sp.]
MKKMTLLMVVMLILSVGLIGCTTKPNAPESNGTETPKTESNNENLLETIKTQGTIRFGTEGTYAPFTFHDSTGKLTGFDVEVAEEVAKRLGVKAEFIETKWDGMFAGLDAKRFDAIVNEVSIRPDRLEKYDFSDPYIVSKAVLIVNEDNGEIKDFADLKGKKAAQSLTSNLADIARENGAEIVQIDGFNQAIDILTSGRADATINDSLSFLDLKKQKPELAIKVVAEQQDAAQMGIMFNKGNEELVDAVNKALSEMKADGTYLQISEKWFGTDVSK